MGRAPKKRKDFKISRLRLRAIVKRSKAKRLKNEKLKIYKNEILSYKEKIMKKQAVSLLCVSAIAFSCVGTACKKTPDTEQTLEVIVHNLGYGYKWCEDMLESFQQADWVKEKYPELEVVFTPADDGSLITSRMEAGADSNTVDLFFTTGGAYIGKDAQGKAYCVELTEDLYGSKVPGEEVTVYEKLLPTYQDAVRYYDRGQDSNDESLAFKSYYMPWASGYDGILYNADILSALNIAVPLTTDEMLLAFDRVSKSANNVYNKGYAIMRSGDADYWEYAFPIWWAQYEGVENYTNFFNGIADGRLSRDIFDQEGRLKSLEVFEEVLKWENNYSYKYAASLGFMDAQTNFFMGEGVFMFNGDWLQEEMREMSADIKETYGYDYDIRFMKTPIVSSIIEKTPSIADDAELHAVVAKIDEGYTTAASAGLDVTEEDYQTIMEARGIQHAIGPSHYGFIPEYAKGKDVAIDFLRYMATDEAQEIYIDATGGASLPFAYDVKEKNPTLYNDLWSSEKDRMDFTYDVAYEVNVLPELNNFPLMKYGGLSMLHSLNTMTLVTYFASEGATGTAQKLFDDDRAYWTQERFTTCLVKAGLQ